MKNIATTILLSLGAIMGLASCDDVFEPVPENLKDLSQMYDDSRFAQGFLVNVYRNLPGYYDDSEYATDDAVTNLQDNAFRKMASGAWTSQNDPMSQWVNSLNSIQNLNLFIENADRVKWADDPETAALFRMRTIGEAHGLRALYMYYLLRNHAGPLADGTMAGVPMLKNYLTVNSDFNMARATFAECVQMILDDVAVAEKSLPVEYESISLDSEVPAPFNAVTSNPGTYNRVMGEYGRQLMNAQIARAVRSRVLLLAASPAFASDSFTWEQAADAAAAVLSRIGGVNGIDPTGATFYCNTSVLDNLADGVNPAEIIWREGVGTNNTLEKEYLPPSLYGNGRMNPTQNLVDAFPAANGFPISDPRSNYNPSNPYANRDPRLKMYIIYNGATAGVNNTVISTGSDATTADGLNKRETSTRTGYYMKKRLRMDVNCDPAASSTKVHYRPRMRYTEFLLNYAEAANEAWGPTGTGSHGYSAFDVVRALRKRVGITDETYLLECAASKDAMRTLIRNERRLELCFESFRFWDLRRWKVSLCEDARGVDIRNNSTYTPIPSVEKRMFTDYMYYGPIPYSEVLKFGNLKQNAGW